MFHEIITRLGEYGWVKDTTQGTYWKYSKGCWECQLYWNTGAVVFYNTRKGYYDTNEWLCI